MACTVRGIGTASGSTASRHPVVFRDEDADAHPGTDELLDEQRGSVRAVDDRRDERRGQDAGAEQRVDKRGRVGGRQRREVQPIGGAPLGVPLEEARPRRRHDEPPRPARGATGMVEEGEQVAPRPVHVLDEPQCRTTAERIEREDPRREPHIPLRREVATGGVGIRARIEETGDLGDDHGRTIIGNVGGEQGGPERLRIDGFRPEQLGDRLVGRGRLRSNAGAEDGGRDVERRHLELDEEAALPDSGRRHHHDPSRDFASGHVPHRVTQPGEVIGPAHEPRTERAHRGLARRMRACADRAPRADRIGLALQLERPDADRFDRLRRAHRRQLANEDRSRLGSGLEASGRVHRIPGHAARVGTGRGVHDLAGIHPDPQIERPGLQPQPGAKTLDGADQRQARPHGTLRIVVTAAWDAEDGHRRVTDELLDARRRSARSSRGSWRNTRPGSSRRPRHPVARRAA